MKKISQDKINKGLQASRARSQEEISSFTRKTIDNMFARLLAICAGSMAQARKDPNYLADVKAEWFIAFKDSQVRSEEQIEKGYKLLRESGRDFLPNPGRFVKWCLETSVGRYTLSESDMLDMLHNYHSSKIKTEQFGDPFPVYKPIVHKVYSMLEYAKINTESHERNVRAVKRAMDSLAESGYVEVEVDPSISLPSPKKQKENRTLEQIKKDTAANKAAAKKAFNQMMESLR